MNKYIGENRLTYLWGKIKAFVSNAISGKVDKVSSTDNAVVRFDGTSGDIQNSGVTINDNNQLTAAKLITSGGTSSQFVKGDGSLDSTTYAPLTSPALTGTPTAPTAASGTNTTQIATTAFVQSAIPKDYQVDYSKQYLTTVARENGTISFNIWQTMGTDLITSISYSTDNGKTWTTTNNQNNKSENLVISVNVNAGDKVLWKGIAQQTGFYDEEVNEDYVGSFFSSDCEFDVQGNVMSLCYGDNFIGQTILNYEGQFTCLFCDYNRNIECNVVNAKDLSLPATTLDTYCYYEMFWGCTALTTAPSVLPATTLAQSCYSGMFSECTSLTSAPELPATTLAQYCYAGMFSECTSLTSAPELPATKLAKYCYFYMFNGCSNLNYIKAMFTTTPGRSNTQDWVSGVAASGTFVKNDSATWATTGVNAVPSGWTVYTESEWKEAKRYELASKADKVVSATSGNFAALDSNGNLTDSGHKHSDYLTQHQDISNYIQKSNTAGLVKNDGTIDTNTYLTTHQDITGKVDKVSSPTDNAIVRFDGTSGGIQNSGVTINDNNQLTAAKLITSGGTSSQFVKGDGSLDSNTYAGAQTSGGAANKAVSIPFGQVDSTSTSTAFTATVDGITELRDGVCVYLKNGVVTSASGYTININNLGAKPVYQTMAAATASTTGFNINYTMLFVYNSSRVVGGCWDMFYGYYYNTDVLGYDIREYNSGSKKVKTACQRYQIMLTCMDGMLLPVYSGAYSNGTSKTLTTEKFNPLGQIYYYYSTTNLSAEGSPAAGTLVSQFTYTTVDIRYSFNTGSTLTVGNDIYLVCVPQDDGSAVLHTSPIAFSLPSTEDGLIYKRLGKAYSTYSIALEQDKPCYHYKNGSINLWTGTGTQTDVSKSTESNVIDVAEYDLMKINEVKGKSLVMNQNCSLTSSWSGYTSIVDSYEATLSTSSNTYSVLYFKQSTPCIPSHVYLSIGLIKINSYTSGSFVIFGLAKTSGGVTRTSWQNVTPNVSSTEWQRISSIHKIETNTNANNLANFYIQFNTAQLSYSIKYVMLFDLTQMFGEGHEPTTVEEVETILGSDYYEYNTGEVVGNSVEKLDVYDSNDTKKGSLALNLTELTGKVNGEGTSVTIFPDGLHGVGTAFDSLIVDEDGYARRAVKRMGSVDLGDVRWVIDGDNFRSQYKFPSVVGSVDFIASNTSNILCIKYTSSQIDVHNGQYVYITDSNYSDAATFKTAMSGVMLYYELATPIEYVLDTPVQCVAKVYPNGTVKQVPVMPDSTPMVMGVTYLRDNGGFIGGMMNKLASLEARIAALEGG